MRHQTYCRITKTIYSEELCKLIDIIMGRDENEKQIEEQKVLANHSRSGIGRIE